MNRLIRYQGAIIQNDQILLILHREHVTDRAYWVLPGGGLWKPPTAMRRPKAIAAENRAYQAAPTHPPLQNPVFE
jgi:hypothetical protein